MSKDSNNNNSDSKYDRGSKNLKRVGNIYSEEEIFNFGEHSSESGTLSSVTKTISSRKKYYIPRPVLQIEGEKIY